MKEAIVFNYHIEKLSRKNIKKIMKVKDSDINNALT